MAPNSKKKTQKKDSGSDYLRKRDSNNAAVQKSREKKRKYIEGLQKSVEVLNNEDEELQKILQAKEHENNLKISTIAAQTGYSIDDIKEMMKGTENMSSEEATEIFIQKMVSKQANTQPFGHIE